MVQSSWLIPFIQVGRELRIELHASFPQIRTAQLILRARRPSAPVLPDQRIDDEHIVARRKADALLSSVRLGAVRR
jgi:hypothetical protein